MFTLSKAGLAVAVLWLMVCATSSFAQSEKAQRAELKKYLETEMYVLKQVAAGNIANLEEKFPNDEQKRVLRYNFVEALLINSDKIKIHRNGILISGARITGNVNLANANIENFVYLVKCQFEGVFFFQTVFKKGLTIDGSSFKGKADLSYATILEGLQASNTKFLNESEEANFTRLKVMGPTSFEGSEFSGQASFVYAVIDGPFYMNNVKFLCKDDAKPPCKDTEVSFNTMKINNGFFAYDAVFERPVNLINAKIVDNFEGNNSTFKKFVTFEMMTLGRNLFLSQSKFSDAVNFRSAEVKGSIDLSDARFENSQPVAFRDTKASLVLMNNTMFSRSPNFSNFTYQDIYPTRGILELIKNSDSDYSAYMELEKCLQRYGFGSQADEVFMEMKKYERRKGLNRFDSLKSYLSQALQGFGRRPQRVVYYDLVVLLFGAFLFRRKKMALKGDVLKTQDEDIPKTTEHLPPYNAFLYSLTLFAPTIDTQYTNNWTPERRHRKTRWYLQVHKVLGYILVPLTIAIWTGIFR